MKSRTTVIPFLLLLCSAAHAQNYFDRWLERVSKTQAEQPHWITPLVTVTPRLEEEYRFDAVVTPGAPTVNLGNGKGLDLIPSEQIEVIIGVPPYIEHNSPALHDGWGDTAFLVKYRLAAASRDRGDYIVTAFLGT